VVRLEEEEEEKVGIVEYHQYIECRRRRKGRIKRKGRKDI
jgi:hypothetical protein